MDKKISYRLGLDLGTNSIGWAIYSLDDKKEPLDLVDLGVRIFSDGRDPKTKEPLAVARRTARGQRKLIYRRKLRRKQTFRLLLSQGLFPPTKEECLKLKSLNPYELRAKALDSKLEAYELGRTLFNLSVRRGFKSNRKDAENQKEENSKSTKLSQKDMQNELAKAISESGCRSLGEFLWKNKNEKIENGGIRGTRFVPGRMTYYPTRQMYIDEFNAIRNVQEKYFSDVDWDAIYKSIFDQRPLKTPERGRCTLMPDNYRAYKALPSSEKIRVLQEMRNLNYSYTGSHAFPLSEENEKKLLKLLYEKSELSFDKMRKELVLPTGRASYSGGLFPEIQMEDSKSKADITFNLESENRTKLLGCPTATKMRGEKYFGSLWDNLSLAEQDDIVEKLITADENSEVLKMLSKYDLTDKQKENITKWMPPAGTTMLCKEVQQQLIEKMESCSGITLTVAEEMLGFKHGDQSVEKYDELPYYGKVLVGSTMGIERAKYDESNPEKYYGKISNPTVHVALNQTRTVVNALIKQYGRPTQIVVELSRDLKESRSAKEETQRRIRENTKKNEAINKNLTDAYKIAFPSRNDRLKFRLWEELGTDSLSRKCIYCGKVISGAELFTKSIEIEHILPFGRTLLDAESNKTVAHASCNAYKGNRTPFEAFGASRDGYDWNGILTRAAMLKDFRKRSRFKEDAMETFEKDSGFIARQLTDNAYLSKAALKYLGAVCDDRWAVTGGMTKLLRDKWDIDSILKRKIGDKEIAHFGLKDEQIGTYKKNRYDHRHHALDASVIALIDRSMVKQISDMNQRGMKNRIEAPQMPVLRTELVEKVRKIVPSIKPDHGAQGKLSKETLLGKIKNPEDGKEVYVSRTAIATFTSEKDLTSIIDKKIREDMQAFVKENAGRKFEEVMGEYTKKTGVKKVRCKNKDQKPIEIKGAVSRFYSTEDYFTAIVWQMPDDAFKIQCIRRNEVIILQNGKQKIKDEVLQNGKPHPAAKMIGEFYKDDYLEFSYEGKLYLGRIAGYDANGNRFDVQPVYSSKGFVDWLIATNDIMTEPCWKIHKGQNYMSVNVLFGKMQAHLVTVNPIGRVFRKSK